LALEKPWQPVSVLENLDPECRRKPASGLVKADWRPHSSEFSHLLYHCLWSAKNRVSDLSPARRALLESELSRWLPLLIAHEQPDKIIL
jgi:hypothetical protein